MLIKSLPKSNATTVLELLDDVKRAILEEPRRANMNYLAYKAHKGIVPWSCRLPQANGGVKYVHRDLPAPMCGTAGCFAGWVQLLVGKTPEQTTRDWTEGAVQILGSDLDYYFFGPDGSPHHVFNWGEGDGIVDIKPGTRAYARAVVRRINGFIERNGGRKGPLATRPLNVSITR